MTNPGDGLYEKLSAFREDIFRVCLGFSRNVADAEDLCQDVFLKALIRRDSLRDLGGARIWLLFSGPAASSRGSLVCPASGRFGKLPAF